MTQFQPIRSPYRRVIGRQIMVRQDWSEVASGRSRLRYKKRWLFTAVSLIVWGGSCTLGRYFYFWKGNKRGLYFIETVMLALTVSLWLCVCVEQLQSLAWQWGAHVSEWRCCSHCHHARVRKYTYSYSIFLEYTYFVGNLTYFLCYLLPTGVIQRRLT